MEMKLQHIRICGMQLKQYLEGSLQHLNAYIKKKEKPQVSDLSFHIKKINPKISKRNNGKNRNK